ncbi:hypothetical protein [Pseudomonas parafulva]|uniref:Uncharacterized protein n=1 Tax=Pseudomonas parafulva TaxID=157782 RepID=A0AAJ0LLU7_9PSED|nr:hypothetical protein [Pseudomonas parafulva]KTT19099.1 hypothetical protein NS96R_05960 [Pseudomonas parafulva]
MPTENRSSNTAMVSDKLPPCADDVFKKGVSACLVGDVPKHAAETICRSLSAVTGWKIDWHYVGGRTHIKALAPAPQPHPDPIAWMVGTAFWWTKEEAERDAADTGLPILGLGPMLDSAEVERLRAELRVQDELLEDAYQRDIGTPLKRKIRTQRVALSASAEPSEPVAEAKP